MNGVAATGPQHPEGLGDDRLLGVLALHREHGFAHDDVGAVIVQPGVGRVGGDGAATRTGHRGAQQRRVRGTVVDADV